MRSKLVAAVACVILVGLVPAGPVASAAAEPELRITFFSFGYGDAATKDPAASVGWSMPAMAVARRSWLTWTGRAVGPCAG